MSMRKRASEYPEVYFLGSEEGAKGEGLGQLEDNARSNGKRDPLRGKNATYNLSPCR